MQIQPTERNLPSWKDFLRVPPLTHCFEIILYSCISVLFSAQSLKFLRACVWYGNSAKTCQQKESLISRVALCAFGKQKYRIETKEQTVSSCRSIHDLSGIENVKNRLYNVHVYYFNIGRIICYDISHHNLIFLIETSRSREFETAIVTLSLADTIQCFDLHSTSR